MNPILDVQGCLEVRGTTEKLMKQRTRKIHMEK